MDAFSAQTHLDPKYPLLRTQVEYSHKLHFVEITYMWFLISTGINLFIRRHIHSFRFPNQLLSGNHWWQGLFLCFLRLSGTANFFRGHSLLTWVPFQALFSSNAFVYNLFFASLTFCGFKRTNLITASAVNSPIFVSSLGVMICIKAIAFWCEAKIFLTLFAVPITEKTALFHFAARSIIFAVMYGPVAFVVESEHFECKQYRLNEKLYYFGLLLFSNRNWMNWMTLTFTCSCRTTTRQLYQIWYICECHLLVRVTKFLWPPLGFPRNW